jgi:hypothetical protein
MKEMREPKGKRETGIPKLRWKDNIKIDLREKGCEDVEKIKLVHNMIQW